MRSSTILIKEKQLWLFKNMYMNILEGAGVLVWSDWFVATNRFKPVHNLMNRFKPVHSLISHVGEFIAWFANEAALIGAQIMFLTSFNMFKGTPD